MSMHTERWTRSKSLIAVLGLALLFLIAVGGSGLPAALAALRLLLGLAYVLFVPGYLLQVALFPRAADVDGAERLALSFGLSVALIPILAVGLHMSPWGLRPWPIVAVEGLTIAAAATAAWWRGRRLSPLERFHVSPAVDVRGWWADQDRMNRILYGSLAGALLIAAVAVSAIVLLPKAGDHFTEFYALGAAGLAEDYPRQAVVGQPMTVTLGIANREGAPTEYRVEIRAQGQLLTSAGPAPLSANELWERRLSYALPRAGTDQAVELLLYREGRSEPYRSLELWVDVGEAK